MGGAEETRAEGTRPRKPTVAEVASDLAAEHRSLDELVAEAPAEAWGRATPSPGWTVADQIGHLAYFDRAAALAIEDPSAFVAQFRGGPTAATGGAEPGDAALSWSRSLDPVALLAKWRLARESLLSAAGSRLESTKLPWFGPSMGTISFLTARLMETWAHGEDVAVALGTDRPATGRLRHVAQLGVMTRGWSYAVRGATPPTDRVRVRLDGPSDGVWEWESDADQSIEGPALDFCRVVTQRCHVADTTLVVQGDAAAEWMRLAQAFAGAPTDGPAAKR